MKNRVGIILYSFIDNYLEYFLDLCHQNNIEADLFSFNEKTAAPESIKNIYYLKTKYSMKNIKSKNMVENEIKKLVNIENYDYILADTIALSFTCSIFHNHSLEWRINYSSDGIVRFIQKLGHLSRLLLEKKHYKNCPKVIAVSELVKKDLTENCSINPENIVVAYPGTNSIGEFYAKSSSGDFTVGMSACGFATKGGYNLLRAVRVLKKEYPNLKIKVKIINPKFKKISFENFYTKLFKIDDIVEFLPFQKNMNSFYSSLDCFVCASRFEAFGRVATEAMLNEVPVIVGSNIGAGEIINDGQNGFVYEYDKNKYKNLAEKIIEVYYKKEQMQEIVKKARETAENLSWENFAQTIFNALYK